MQDDRSAVKKYLVMLIVWLVPVSLMTVAAVRPVEGFTRDLLLLPAIVMLLYAAFLLAPLFLPFKNVDFFDEIPAAIQRIIDSHRARKDARELIKLYDGDRLPNVYELPELTRFQKGVLNTCKTLRSQAEWHASNAEVSRDLLDRLETLMRVGQPEEPGAKTEEKTEARPAAKRTKASRQK